MHYPRLKRNNPSRSCVDKSALCNWGLVNNDSIIYRAAIALAVFQAFLMCLIGGYEKAAPLYMQILAFLIMLIGGGMEEAGWRYITFPELDKKFGFAVSAAITGVIWAIWHLPLFFRQHRTKPA